MTLFQCVIINSCAIYMLGGPNEAEILTGCTLLLVVVWHIINLVDWFKSFRS